MFDGINLGYSFGIGHIATDAPDRVGGVKDYAALSHARNGILNIVFSCHIVFFSMLSFSLFRRTQLTHIAAFMP